MAKKTVAKKELEPVDLSTPVVEELTEATEEVKAMEVVETTEEEPKAVKVPKVKWDFDKLASDEMIAAITKFRNSASQEPSELEALANSCVK